MHLVFFFLRMLGLFFAYAWALLGLGLRVCTDDFAGACRPEHNQGDKV